jgi:hypothetical protein
MINTIYKWNSRIILLALCVALLNFQLISAEPLRIAGDEQSCMSKLEQAEESYYNGDLDQAILLANECLAETAINKVIRIRAYKILARTYLAKDQLNLAKNSIISLLDLDPTYQPTIEEESPRLVNAVAEVRTERERLKAEQEKAGISPWVWIGAGGAAAAAIIVLVATGSGGDETDTTNQPLPGPPALP